ncbi:hypothetical protein GLOIN_2v1499113 [Rhizophagus clarus]|uniref:Uncharacterized protein n=1 Tax=Rhizophagus clarus TaxID=94130 RepID=A0A8H3MDP4_9GLOM|nr:hypothetical protein GLOIN_2v1499113 [Rhizophagus clarus]
MMRSIKKGNDIKRVHRSFASSNRMHDAMMVSNYYIDPIETVEKLRNLLRDGSKFCPNRATAAFAISEWLIKNHVRILRLEL